MEERLKKLLELEEKHAALFKEKADLLEQIGKLTLELDQGKQHAIKLNKELATLTEGLQQVRSQNEGLEVENNDLLSKHKKLSEECTKAGQAVAICKGENAKLREMIDKFKAGQGAAPAVGGTRLPSATGQDSEKVKELEQQKENLQKALNEWTDLAKVSAFELVSVDDANKCAAFVQGVQGDAPHVQAGRSVPQGSSRQGGADQGPQARARFILPDLGQAQRCRRWR